MGEAFLNVHVQDLECRRNITIFGPDEGYFTINIQVSRVTRTGNAKAAVPYTDMSTKITTEELRNGKWLRINVTNMIAEFFMLPRDNLAIIVRVQDTRSRINLVVPHPSSDTNSTLMPFIEVNLKDSTPQRPRRTIGIDCAANSTEVRCCRFPLLVDFEKFGWDWVIAPKQYSAHYCSGECPYSFLQKYPHSSVIHFAARGGACCAPRRMSSISMLYFDHDLNIIYGTLPGMIVESCGCL